MILSLEEAMSLQKGIHELKNLRFSSATTRKIAQNLIALNASFPDADAKRAEILEQCGNPPETDPKFKEVVSLTTAWVKETKVKAEIQTVKFEELNIGERDRQNHIWPAHLALLWPMIDSSDRN